MTTPRTQQVIYSLFGACYHIAVLHPRNPPELETAYFASRCGRIDNRTRFVKVGPNRRAIPLGQHPCKLCYPIPHDPLIKAAEAASKTYLDKIEAGTDPTLPDDLDAIYTAYLDRATRHLE